MFPARCEGIEHFIRGILTDLPDVEMIVNDYDWPKVVNAYRDTLPPAVFSFSKVSALTFSRHQMRSRYVSTPEMAIK